MGHQIVLAASPLFRAGRPHSIWSLLRRSAFRSIFIGMKTPTSYRLSQEALRLLRLLARAKGLSMASVLEVAIRELAKREGVR